MSELVAVKTAAALRELTGAWRASHQTVALVPTMGNLHRGHLTLTELAAHRADRVIMSIFVNPTQFGEGEDFASYPRTLDEDVHAVRAAGTVDVLFAPDVVDVYPFGVEHAVRIEMPPLSRDLCGAARPGHFNGVASVVLRLLNMTQPDVLVLGEKDYQQLVLIEHMIRDLRLPVLVLRAPIQREPDGLAMSSRNRYLTSEERARAPELHRVLADVSGSIRRGGDDFDELAQRAGDALGQRGFTVDYVEIRDAMTLARPNGRANSNDLIVLGAAWLGRARLIDNVRV